MFSNDLVVLKQELLATRKILQTVDKIRNLLSEEDNQKTPELTTEQVADLKAGIPDAADWRVFDHCASITRIYAAYERFIYKLVSTWLTHLPQLYPAYADLPKSVSTQHRVGVSQVLLKLGGPRYSHLNEKTTINGLSSGVSGLPYSLLPEAFLIDLQNLRGNELDKLFQRINMEHVETWISKHPRIEDYIESIIGGSNTATGELERFIGYRNDAAHGNEIRQILGVRESINFCDFFERVCEVLAEFAAWNSSKVMIALGRATEIGEITEHFKKPGAFIAKMKSCKLSINDKVTLISERTCHEATVTNLQVNGKSVDSHSPAPQADLKRRYLDLLSDYEKQTKNEAMGRGAEGAALGMGFGLLLGGPVGWLALLGGALGASSTEKVSRDRLQQVLDAFYYHAQIEQLPVPFVTFHQQQHGQGLDLVKASHGNLAEAVLGSVSNPFIFADVDARDGRRLDPGSDRVSAVPVQDACDAFPGSRLIVINVTGRPAFYARDLPCEVRELRVELDFEPSEKALTGYGEDFETVYQAGFKTVITGLSLPTSNSR